MRHHVVLLRPVSGVFDRLYTVIPLPLLAACRRVDRARFDVTIVDQTIAGWRERLDAALRRDVLAFGITSLTGVQLELGMHLARGLRRHKPGVPVIWGGIHPTCTPEQMLAEPEADVVVIGEAEDTLPELLDALATGADLGGVRGIAYRDGDGRTRTTPPRPPVDVERLEDPPYDLVDVRDYTGADSEFYVEAGRGCTYACTFCYNPVYNRRRWRPRAASRVVDDIAGLHAAHGISMFYLCDDMFLADGARVDAILDGLERRGLDVRLCCEANLSLLQRMDDDALRRLADAGMTWLSVGVESGSPRVLEFLRKPVRLPDLLAFNRRVRELPLRVRYNFMTGYPVETRDDVRSTVELMRRLLADNPRAMVKNADVTVPYPGTVYLQQCVEHGMRTPERVSAWFDHDPWTIHRHLPWMRGSRRRMFDMVMFSTYFIDDKMEFHEMHTSRSRGSRAAALLARLYRPYARARLRRFWTAPFPEAHLLRAANRLQRAALLRETRL